jgi:hypothetical protein
MDALPNPLAAWESFYVIVGSSGGALTGLQFVVMALVADSEMERSLQEVEAFGTPTVVHFCAVLFIAAVLSAPWPSLASAGFALMACGIAGVAYVVLVAVRARRTTRYQPVLEDWVWHVFLPLVAYASVLVGAVELSRAASPSLFVITGAALLLFIGIHNAWDTVTWVAVERRQPDDPAARD